MEILAAGDRAPSITQEPVPTAVLEAMGRGRPLRFSGAEQRAMLVRGRGPGGQDGALTGHEVEKVEVGGGSGGRRIQPGRQVSVPSPPLKHGGMEGRQRAGRYVSSTRIVTRTWRVLRGTGTTLRRRGSK